MDETAIKRIEALACSANRDLGTFAPAMIAPDGAQLVRLETLLEQPLRQRVQFKTERVKDFCRYVKKEAGEGTAVFVRPDGSGAKAVIDFGSAEKPLWKDHSALLDLNFTPEFSAIKEACRQPLSQNDLADFIEDWSHAITPESDGERISTALAIQAIRAVSIDEIKKTTSEVADFEASASALSKISAKSTKGKLPGVLDFRCSVYNDTSENGVRLRVALLTGDKPKFTLRIVGEAALIQKTAEEVELDITEALSGSVPVYLGGVGGSA